MNIAKIPHRSEIADGDKWNLATLFAADALWEELFSRLEQTLDGYARFKGRLHTSARVLRQAIDFDLALSRDLDRLYTYAQLKSDEDRSNQHYLGVHQRALGLVNRAAERASFLVPEILAIPPENMTAFCQSPELEGYGFYLEKILRARPHTLDEPGEELLAMSREVSQVPFQVFGQLDHVDLTFGSLPDGDGKEIELSHGNFSTFLISPRRDVRKKAFFQYYQSYAAHRNTLAAALAGSVKADLFQARARHFDSCRSRALFADDIGPEVYDNLIDTVRGHLDPLFDYLEFRRQALQLEELHFYDTHVPLVGQIDFRLTYPQAVDICVAALEPLGEEYVATLQRGLLSGWVDRYENRGKRSGAYSSGCYDSPPYILMNYEPANINSLYTLIHEAGHSMHSYQAHRHQPYRYHAYAIFVAEVASTFNEMLLSRHLLALYRNQPDHKAYILNREIDNLRATLFRQTMFAEFERTLHARAERHEPLTLEAFTRVYADLLEAYFGGRMVIDEALQLEYLRIPHFYAAFYVYKYATGISAAISLAENVLSQGRPARDAYLDFLKMGGSRFPLDQLRAVGVDMSRPEPVLQAIGYFDQLVGALKKEMGLIGPALGQPVF